MRKLLLWMLLLFMSGCARVSSDRVVDNPLIGTWVKLDAALGDEVAMVFSRRGHYSVDFGVNGTDDVRGDFTVQGDELTMQDRSGQLAPDCMGPGNYRFSVQDQTLTLTLVSDQCSRRSKNFSHSWAQR